ncbi:MAG TPA: hypothetical protein VKT75_05735 [Acidobacteriaceae bacterium]|nr:hypothetical protein [Acidobacteriaceae bacterium]
MHLAQLAIIGLASLLCLAALFGVDVQAATNISVVTTAETLAVVGQAVTLPTNNGKAAIRGFVQLNVGASTTAVTLTIYAGNAIGGRVVGAQNANAGNFTAGQIGAFMVEFTDVLAGVSAAQYCMSVKQTGASGNGTILNAALDTMVLSG